MEHHDSAALRSHARRPRQKKAMHDILRACAQERSQYQEFLEVRFRLQASELSRAIATKLDREVSLGMAADRAWLSVLQNVGWKAQDVRFATTEALESNWDIQRVLHVDRAARRIQEFWQKRRQQRLEVRLMLRHRFQKDRAAPGTKSLVRECTLAHVLEQGFLKDSKQAQTWNWFWQDFFTTDEASDDARLRELSAKVDALRKLRNREQPRWMCLLALLPIEDRPKAQFTWTSIFEDVHPDRLKDKVIRNEVQARRYEAMLGLQPPAAPLLPRKGPPRPRAMRQQLERVTPGLRQPSAEAHKHVVVRVVRTPARAAVNSDGKRKADFAGHIGLKLGLGSPTGVDLDWELVVLNVEHVQFFSMAKLCRGDSIVRVGRMTDVANMLAMLNANDRTGGEEVEHLEIEAVPRFGDDGSQFADAALAVHADDELLKSMDDDVPDVDTQVPLPRIDSEAEQAMLALGRQSEISAPWSQWLQSVSVGREQMACALRLQSIIASLKSVEALDLLRNLTPSASRSATPAKTTPMPCARSSPTPGLSPFPDEHHHMAMEVEALSQSLMAAASGKDDAAHGSAGERLWETLLAGVRSGGAVHRSEPGQEPSSKVLPGLLWTEALFKIGVGALRKRRQELTGLVAQWCIRGVKSDWMNQIIQIDETLGWVSLMLDAIEAQLRNISLGESGSKLVRQAAGFERYPTKSDQDLPAYSKNSFPALAVVRMPVVKTRRGAMLDKTARKAFLELQTQQHQDAHTQETARKLDSQCLPKSSLEGQLLSFRDWRRGPAGRSLITALSGPEQISKRSRASLISKKSSARNQRKKSSACSGRRSGEDSSKSESE